MSALRSRTLSLHCLPDEVLHGICVELLSHAYSDEVFYKFPESRYKGVHALSSLARTSQRLHEHAVNVLWNTLPGYAILVYALPQDAWMEEITPRRNSEYRMVRRLVSPVCLV